METSEASNEDIENENMNGDSNLEPVDIDKTVTDIKDKSDINCDEASNLDKRCALKRKAEDDTVEQTEKIMKVENYELLEPFPENTDSKSKNDEDFDDQSSGDETKLTIKIEDDNTSEKLKSEEDDEENTSQKSEITPQNIVNNQKVDEKLDQEPSKTKLSKPTQISSTEATRQSVRANRNSNPAAFLIKKPKPPTDMSNPAYRKPFLYGWKRELVYRANSESGPKRNGDIYYFTPDGKKVRSMREVLENLKTKELSPENFTFYKEPLGMNDPELEIIRVAKVKGSAPPASFSTHKKFLKAKKEQKLLEKSVVSNNKSKSTKFGSALKIKLSGARLSQSKKSSSKSEKRNKSSKVSLQIGMLPPGWQSSKKKMEKLLDSVPEKVIKLTEQCSVHCEGVAPAIPNLQCSLCLCLYHPECVGFTVVTNADCHENYVCKNCRPEDDSPLKDGKTTEAATSLPPLTPFNAIKTHAPVSTVPPRLHRINHTTDTREQFKKNTRHSKLLNAQQLKTNETNQNHSTTTHVETTKSLVGSVTTWLHSSSTVQMVQSNNDSVASLTNTESSQFQAIITGRKFIVIPRQNVLSVHPNEQTHNTPVENPHSAPHSSISSIPSDAAPLPLPLPTPVDQIPTDTSLGPITYNSEVITIATNNAHSQAAQPIEQSPSLSRSSNAPTTMEQHVRTQWQTDGSLKQTSAPSVKPGKISSARNKKNSQRSSTTSTNSAIEKLEKLEKSKLDTREKEKYMQNFLHHVSIGYSVLLQVFQYLKVQELLRASRVCRMWRDLANHPSLWRTVRMKNSQVRDWKGFVKSLKRHETEILDLRKVLLPGSGDDMWSAFTTELGNADALKRIDLCRCPAAVVEELANSNQNLEVINAISIRCTSVNLSSYEKLKNLRELRLKSQNGVELTNTFSFLEQLTCLKHLSLLSFKDLGKKNIESIAKLIDLESLELGECDSLIDSFGTDVISKLEKIEKLRLEKGPSGTSTYNILEAISKLPKIYQIELVNFDVKTGFDEALALCKNIKRLLLIPTYISQSATTNNMVLNGIFQLTENLTYFIWGVTLELLRVTELFIDQCDQTPKKKQSPKKDKKGTGSDSIPILKPVPSVENFKGGGAASSSDTQDNTQVEILPLNALQKLLTNQLQNTKIKILKIPYHATWRQSINDTIQ